MNKKDILRLENCSKSYTKKNDIITILNNVTLNFERGKFYAIMGKSGAGKSTLIQILGLLDNIDCGKIEINGNDVTKLSESKKDTIRNKNIGFVFQEFYLSPNLNTISNVLLPTYINENLNEVESLKKANSLLKKLDVYDRASHYPNELSGGEQQRVAIARALINDPDILLADEPTGNLDDENEEIVLNLLKNMSKNGKCVIVVSHNKEIKKYADTVLKLENGVLKEI